ncbi:MAG: NAD(P)-dependent alcohol dehydrogenase, partial [Chloroflexota bacterium]
MKAAVLYKAHDLRIEEQPRPAPAADEVLIKIKAVGICGSDMHLYDEGRVGNAVLERPIVLGHEAAGEVVEVGSAVTALKVGDRVAIEPGVPDRTCVYCKHGDYHLCPQVTFRGVPHVDGLFAEYATTPADFAFRLPDNLDYVQGAMLEPLAVGLQSTTEGNVAVGQSVAIYGSGPIGLSSLQAAIMRGASNTMIIDVIPKRLELAKKLGATHIINGAQVNAVEEVARLTGGLGADVVLETAAAVPTIQQSLFTARRGGTVVFTGIPSQAVIPLDIVRIVRSRMKISGCFRYVNQYPVAVAIAASGKVDVKA